MWYIFQWKKKPLTVIKKKLEGYWRVQIQLVDKWQVMQAQAHFFIKTFDGSLCLRNWVFHCKENTVNMRDNGVWREKDLRVEIHGGSHGQRWSQWRRRLCNNWTKLRQSHDWCPDGEQSSGEAAINDQMVNEALARLRLMTTGVKGEDNLRFLFRKP